MAVSLHLNFYGYAHDHIWFYVQECKWIYFKTDTALHIVLHCHFNHQFCVVIPRFKFDFSQCCHSKIIPQNLRLR